ncbi:unnamed protein product [Prorocentrum cordatum]|uniref:Uncharacterized protein n=1 Tax=Prorocentrum cordatum TaxID=2364126 RepID=A0ABN9WT91_9DINO|nr:unnamed protein product [Polarella glacialis]
MTRPAPLLDQSAPSGAPLWRAAAACRTRNATQARALWPGGTRPPERSRGGAWGGGGRAGRTGGGPIHREQKEPLIKPGSATKTRPHRGNVRRPHPTSYQDLNEQGPSQRDLGGAFRAAGRCVGNLARLPDLRTLSLEVTPLRLCHGGPRF